MRQRIGVLLSAVLALIVAAASSGPAPAASCVYPSSYPGDSAPKATLAAWMAGGAEEAGLPVELPVMAALVESNVQNLNQPDVDSAGYFQMPKRIWNSGDYAGFPEHPTLQLQWFIDQAQAVRQKRIAAGDATYGEDPARYGEWVADVERPAEQYRGRYQLRLDEARQLIASGCAAPDPASPAPTQPAPAEPTPGGVPAQQLLPDSVLPVLKVVARRYQDVARRGELAVSASCANERCLVRAALAFAVPKRRVVRASVAPVSLRRGEQRILRIALTKRARRLVARSGCPLAVVRVIAANAGGYRLSASRTVLLGTRRACSQG